MTAPRLLSFRRRSLVRLLSGSAIGAALCAFPGSAWAQGFQGSHSVVTGGAGVTTAPDYTGVEIVAPETVIEWTPFDNAETGTIDFLPEGATVEFAELTGTFDYTVLNRIIPLNADGNPTDRAVAFNGTVTSRVGNFPGGNVWFYSPAGIIAGPTARFNVGSLILTTDDIVFGTGNTGGTELFGPGGAVQFRGPAASTSFVDVQAGAEITATGSPFGPAYVALVAPRVVQAGQVSADGQIAYVAAEQIDMTINAGLFDFTVLVGTTDANGIVHTGITTGPASTGVADAQRIAMVALPKNDALTMLLSGSVGYTPAASAFAEGSSIVLSAGFDSASPDADPGNRLADVSIGNATFRNVLTGFASGDVAIAPAGGSTAFENVAAFDALQDISVIAETGQDVTAISGLTLRAGEPGTGGNVLLEARDTGVIDIAGQLNAAARSTAFYAPAAGDAAGGTIAVTADGGTIDILQGFVEAYAESALGGTATGGTIEVSALNGGAITATNFLSLNVSASVGSPGTQGGEAIGGSASLTASGGTIAIGSAFLDAGGFGGFGGTLAGDGAGGMLEASVLGGGSLTADFLSLDAGGFGGVSDAQGGNGTGGAVSLSDLGGLLDLGTVVLSAGAAGGNGGTNAGDGVGGTAVVAIASQAQSWDALIADAGATAGGPADGSGLTGNATAQADAVTLSITGPGSLSLASALELTANASMNVNGQPGFTGQAGGVAIDVGPGGALTVDGTILAQASAFVEDEAGFPSNWDSSPTQQGGTVSITADGGTITAFELEARAEAHGLYAAAAAGTATGGSVTASAVDGGAIRIDNGSGGALALLSADGLGAPGPVASDAVGGSAQLIAEDGSISVAGDISLSASGRIAEFFDPLPAGEGFSATGGQAGIELRAGTNGTAFIAGDDLEIVAVGDSRQILSVGTLVPGEVPIEGDAGTATGGTVSLAIMAGELAFDDVALDSSGTGGTSAVTDGTVAFRSGDGLGGSSVFTIGGGYAAIGGSLELTSNGAGGGGSTAGGVQLAGLAGNGTGGSATLRLNGGALTVQQTDLEATGAGGFGMDHEGSGNATDGGTGLGGTAALVAPSGWAGSFSTQTLHIEANGEGGDGGVAAGGADGQGGSGTGFAAAGDLADGAFSLGEVTIEATGTGGDGTLGGEGAGGQARFALADSATGSAGPRTIDDLFIDASGFGGLGSAGPIAASDAGETELTVAVLDSDAALAVRGNLSIFGAGSQASATAGIDTLVSGAPLDIGGSIVLSTSGDIGIAAGQPLHSVGDMALSGQTVAATGLLDADGALSVQGANGIDIDHLASGGATLLQASNGPLVVATDLASAGVVTATGRSIDITALGGLSFDDARATAGDVEIATAGDLIIAQATANDALDLASGGTFTLTGEARGFSIAVTSADIVVGADAQLGFQDLTSAILLVNGNAGADTFIGGEAQAGGYSLDAAEAARLFADESISLLAGGNMTVGDLALSFGPGATNIGGGGTLEISTPAAISITGNVALTTSRDDDTFLIDPTSIELDTGSGSIAMLDGSGNPLGRLSMVGDRIAVADADALGLLRTATDFAEINAALDLPGGSAEPVRAGAIVFDVADALFIQNGGASDAYADRRGFAASSVEIVTADPANRIAVNGQILTAGGPVGGLDTAPLVVINGEPAAAGGRFDPASTINGCAIGSNCAFVPPPPPPPELPTEDPPTSVDLERPGLVGEPAGSQFTAPLIELAETEPLITPPLVDEPITGIGNDDLWVSPCEPGNESCEGADTQQ